MENFITEAEAQHVIKVGLPTMHRSLAGGRTESIRTSSTGTLPAHDAVVRSITERAALLTGYPYSHIEPLQLVKYTEGQKYQPHFDYGEACDYEEKCVPPFPSLASGPAAPPALWHNCGCPLLWPKLQLVQWAPSRHDVGVPQQRTRRTWRPYRVSQA